MPSGSWCGGPARSGPCEGVEPLEGGSSTVLAAFIREFERPLLDQRGSRSVLRAELALSPDRGSLEVRLAPTDGRRYPNLSDHRTNVEYDVERVVNLLNDRRFICGPLRARGPWVAIPVRLKPDLHKEGDA